MYRYWLLLLMVVIMTCLLAGSCYAGGWYVRTASDKRKAGDGRSIQTPWKGFASIKWGVKGVKPGDTLYLLPDGPFHETLTIGVSGTPGAIIEISCLDGGTCLIDGDDKRYAGIDGNTISYVTVSGIEVKNHKNSGLRFQNAGESITVQKCVAHHNGYFGILVNAHNNNMHDITISDNTAFNNGKDKLGAGIYLATAKNGHIDKVLINRNQTYRNTGRYGIGIYPQHGGTVAGAEVSGNVSYENGSTGIDFSKRVYDSVIIKNICYENGLTMPGAGIHLGGEEEESVRRVQVLDNIVTTQHFKKTDGPGILIDDFVQDVQVSGNFVLGNQEAGIKLHNCTNISVSNNTILGNPVGVFTPSAIKYQIFNNYISNSTNAGIYVAGTSDGSIISGNEISDTRVGLHVASGAKHSKIRDNCIHKSSVSILVNRRSRKLRQDNAWKSSCAGKILPFNIKHKASQP